MKEPIPQNANEFIEQQLHERIRVLEAAFEADVIGFIGDLVPGVDDIMRNAIESKNAEPPHRDKLVVTLTTSGGYIQVVQRFVDTMRHHYTTVEFVVPNYAFSAGTVLVLSGDAIHMNYYSRLGPIDPQVPTATGRPVPALGYLIQWERLLEKARNGALTTAEMHLMVYGFDQAELYRYEQERDLSIKLLEEWLAKYKFKSWKKTQTRDKRVTDNMRRQRAREIATELNNTDRWKSHGYGISMQELRSDLNLMIDDFDDNPSDPKLGEKIKSYYNLLDDYMVKRGNLGVLHMDRVYSPFM